MAGPARSNRRILLAKRPAGIPEPSDFSQDEVPVGEPGEGQLLVRNIYLSVDPAQRGWASDATNYADPVPIGGVMRALGVGQVVRSRHPDFAEGSHVYGWLGWQEYAVITPAEVLTRWGAPELPLSNYGGLLGINGLTAHIAFHRLGRPETGETVLVSTAAGAVGSLVGQLAKAAGCRTIGLTGSDDKVALCRERFGYDDAINYRSDDLAGALQAAAPGGFDIFFDSAGGSILDTGIRQMRGAGRVIQCGTASIPAWSPPPEGLRNEREMLTRRLTWSGFVIFDHIDRFGETIAALTSLAKAGKIAFDEDIRSGIEAAPQALADLYAGRNRGKTLIALGGDGV